MAFFFFLNMYLHINGFGKKLFMFYHHTYICILGAFKSDWNGSCRVIKRSQISWVHTKAKIGTYSDGSKTLFSALLGIRPLVF